MNLKPFLRKIIGLSKTIIEDVDLGGEVPGASVRAKIRPSWRKQRCGECGRPAIRLHGQRPKERSWRHLGAFGHRVFLKAQVFRVLCRHCGVRTMEVPWARVGSMFTRVFENEVTWFAQKTDKTATAEYFGISWVTVGNIIERVVADQLDESLLKNLYAIGVDEICYGRPKKYLTVVTNLLTGRVVWSGEGQSSATFMRFFDEIGKDGRAQIGIITMDMDSAFEKAVRQKVPDAEIVYDRFHVMQLVTNALDEVRREIMRTLDDDPELRDAIKGSRWSLLKNPWNLTRRQNEKLSVLATSRKNGKLYRAYLLKEAFRDIFACETTEEADTEFAKWYAWARRSQIEPLKQVATTIKKRWEGIRRYIELHYTNGLAEGFNSKIRMLSHRAFGFHSSAALISMIYLCCSGIVITPLGH